MKKVENKLNVELKKITKNMIMTKVKTSVDNAMTELHRVHTIAVNPKNPTDFLIILLHTKRVRTGK